MERAWVLAAFSLTLHRLHNRRTILLPISRDAV
jgi:hypothetical protein